LPARRQDNERANRAGGTIDLVCFGPPGGRIHVLNSYLVALAITPQ